MAYTVSGYAYVASLVASLLVALLACQEVTSRIPQIKILLFLLHQPLGTISITRITKSSGKTYYGWHHNNLWEGQLLQGLQKTLEMFTMTGMTPTSGKGHHHKAYIELWKGLL